MFSKLARILATAIVVCGASAATATPITYNFTATDFYSTWGAAVPTSSVSGNLTIDGLNILSFNMAIGTSVFGTADVGSQSHYGWGTLIGGNSCATNCMYAGTDDFYLIFAPNQLPYTGQFVYTAAGVSDFFSAGTVTVVEVSDEVPEPATALLVGAALLAGISLRRRA